MSNEEFAGLLSEAQKERIKAREEREATARTPIKGLKGYEQYEPEPIRGLK